MEHLTGAWKGKQHPTIHGTVPKKGACGRWGAHRTCGAWAASYTRWCTGTRPSRRCSSSRRCTPSPTRATAYPCPRCAMPRWPMSSAAASTARPPPESPCRRAPVSCSVPAPCPGWSGHRSENTHAVPMHRPHPLVKPLSVA